MVQKSRHPPVAVPMIYRDLYIPSGCLGFLIHQQCMLHKDCDALMALKPNHQPAHFAAAKIRDAQWKSDNKWVVNNP